MSSKQKQQNIIPDIPLKELKDYVAETGQQQVNLQIQRRMAGNKRCFITPERMTPVDELIRGEIVTWLQAYAGGGNYILLARDPTSFDAIGPRWEISLPGAPKDPQAAAQGMPVGQLPMPGQPVLTGAPQPFGGAFQAGGGVFPQALPQAAPPAFGAGAFGGLPPGIPRPVMQPNGALSAPPADQIPGWARTYPLQQQWSMYYDRLEKEGKLPSGASMHSDQLAHHWAMQGDSRAREQAAENAQLRERLQALEKERAAETARMHEERARIERESLQRAHEAQLASLRSEIAAVREAREAPRPTMDWGPIVAGVASVATAVVPALINAAAERRTAELRATLEQSKTQHEQTALILAQSNQKSGTDWPALLAALTPLAAPLLASFGPAARAEMDAAAVEQRMMLFKMIGDQLVAQAQAQGDVPKWLPLVESAIEAAGTIGAQVLANRAAGPNGHAPRTPAQIPAGPPAIVAPPAAQGPFSEESWARLAQVDAQAAQMTRMVFDNIPDSAGFHTHEWKMVLFNLHMRVQPQEIAPMLARQLLHCQEYQMMPVVLEGVFDDSSKVDPVILGLPVAKMDAEYATAVIGAVHEELQHIREAFAEEAEEEEEQVRVTPAPAGVGSTVEVEGAEVRA